MSSLALRLVRALGPRFLRLPLSGKVSDRWLRELQAKWSHAELKLLLLVPLFLCQLDWQLNPSFLALKWRSALTYLLIQRRGFLTAILETFKNQRLQQRLRLVPLKFNAQRLDSLAFEGGRSSQDLIYGLLFRRLDW